MEDLNCPLCGGAMATNDKAYGCSNWKDADGGCKFKVWKSICDRPITEEEAAKLVKEGKSDLLEGFVSKKTGNPFSAHLIPDAEWGTKFVFPPRK